MTEMITETFTQKFSGKFTGIKARLRGGVALALLAAAMMLLGNNALAAGNDVRQLFFSGSELSHRLLLSYAGEDGSLKELKLPLLGWRHEVSALSDPASGLPTGKRVHKSLILVREADRASPALLQAMLRGIVFDTVVIETFRGAATGEPLRVITIEDAWISTAQTDASRPEAGMQEIYGVSYQKIVWSFASGRELEDQVDLP